MKPDNFFMRFTPHGVQFVDPLCGDPRFEALAEKIVPAREFKAVTGVK